MCYTFLESAHHVESNDTLIANKNSEREFRELKILKGQLGDLNSKKFSWFCHQPPYIDPLQNLKGQTIWFEEKIQNGTG